MADFTTFKRGMTFNSEVTWTPAEGEPADLLGYTVTSALRDSAFKTFDLTVTNPSGDGINYIARLEDSTGLTTGPAAWDFKVSGTGGINYTQTWTFNVIPQVTL